MAVKVYDCPNCGAHLLFKPELQKLHCEYCDVSFTIEEMDSYLAQKEEEEKRRAAQGTDAAASDTAPQPAAPTSSEEKPEAPQADPNQWDEAAALFMCERCGATVVTDQNTAATFCAFCGAPSIISARLENMLKPSTVIPFKITKDRALDSFFAWCKKGRLTPRDFVSQKNVEKITGRYVPFWLFDYDAKMIGDAKAVKISVASGGGKTITTTAHYDIHREQDMTWGGIPHDGSAKIDDGLMELIEPYDTEGFTPFSMEYLSGFFADKYDVHAQDLFPKMDKRVNEYLQTAFSSSIKGYDRVTSKIQNHQFNARSAKYTMMPVWFLNYKYRSKIYSFVVNGQTGKTAGDLPKSPLKILIILIAVLIASTILCWLIGGFLLGGPTI